MPSKEEKQKRKKILDELGAISREKFIAGLPMPIEKFQELFDFLDEQLGENGDCDHTTRHTEAYLKAEGEIIEKVIFWLNESGGYCDCEVLMNVEEHFENL